MNETETIDGMLDWVDSNYSTSSKVKEVVLRGLAGEVRRLRSHVEFFKAESAWKEPLFDGYPERDEWVLAIYEGVYPPRYVRYWVSGETHHFGGPSADMDGRGSQPITHWMRVPFLHNANMEAPNA
jgi:hypothetical protein